MVVHHGLGINAIYKAIPLINKIKDELYPSLPSDEDLGQASISLNIIECSPGALSIVPDKCMLSLDRRTLPGETAESAVAQIQKIIDELAADDPEFKADVVAKTALETSYTGMEYNATKDMSPWKIDRETRLCEGYSTSAGIYGTDGRIWVLGFWNGRE